MGCWKVTEFGKRPLVHYDLGRSIAGLAEENPLNWYDGKGKHECDKKSDSCYLDESGKT